MTRIVVASHRACSVPDDPVYFPVQAGAALRAHLQGWHPDDSGEHISEKNPSFCELTALYWAWKHAGLRQADYIGLVHYRRYFAGENRFGKHGILTTNEVEKLLYGADVIVPVKRRYYIETIRQHYAHAHVEKDIETLRDVVAECAPDYLDAFDTLMARRSLHLYNMFVMQRTRFEAYCSWLFPLLFEMERRSDIGNYDAYQKRVFGFLAERLFNVWLIKNNWRLQEVNVANLEGENLLKKGILMLKRKWFG